MAFKEESVIFQHKFWRFFFRVMYSLCGGLFVLIAEKIIEYVASYFFPGGSFFSDGLVLLSNGAALATFLVLLIKEIWEHMKG